MFDRRTEIRSRRFFVFLRVQFVPTATRKDYGTDE